jgi:hypothetical protein
LYNADAALLDQPYRLNLELAAVLPSVHSVPPVRQNTLSKSPPNRQHAKAQFCVIAPNQMFTLPL